MISSLQMICTGLDVICNFESVRGALLGTLADLVSDP